MRVRAQFLRNAFGSKMNLLYCHDNVYFHSETGEVYSQGQFPSSYFQVFLEHFDNLTVLGRGVPLNRNLDISKLNLSSDNHIEFELMPNINSIKGLASNYFKVNKEVERLVENADAVVIRAVSDLGWLTYKHAKRLGKPIAMEMAACAWDSTWNHGSLQGRLYAPVRYIRDKIITQNSDFVIYVSQSFLQARYPTNGHTAVASNVRIDKPPSEILDKRIAKINQQDQDTILTIGLIGTLSHKLKGVQTALEALKGIESKTPGRFIFKVLGPGKADQYRKIANDLGIGHCVFFEGVIRSGDAVLNWLDNVDIYIQPSYQEGVPRATIEAMSRGCTCAGSTAGGIPELLPPEWLHKPGDTEKLQDILSELIDNKSARLKAAELNFEKASFYTSDKLRPIRSNFWKEFKSFTQNRINKNPIPAPSTHMAPAHKDG